ncbi:replication protein A1, large subunit, putative [Plasmodium gallinaceum]|uniref:Replication protein A1, large subunit, putative n=1 Tax=Plasmodium gallinaceum TaxID=5849 RepID=A0A1J1H3V5_PLAGA|nr:replication protein A1, large subunit, putative [Plasmodium gallinaceum]CRG98167.1 replication protein A1, large subunit, putative [Plasmodium gallinaceum]
MNKNEEILSKATPNFIYKFFTQPDSEETSKWLNSEINLICFSQMSAGANQTFLKVIDGSIPPQYYAIVHLGMEDNGKTISYVKKMIKIENFSITNYYGKLFILAKKVTIFLNIDDFDIEDLFKKYHLQSISYFLLNSQNENNNSRNFSHTNDYNNENNSKNCYYQSREYNNENNSKNYEKPKEYNENNIRSGYSNYHTTNDNFPKEHKIKSYNLNYNENSKNYHDSRIDNNGKYMINQMSSQNRGVFMHNENLNFNNYSSNFNDYESKKEIISSPQKNQSVFQGNSVYNKNNINNYNDSNSSDNENYNQNNHNISRNPRGNRNNTYDQILRNSNNFRDDNNFQEIIKKNPNIGNNNPNTFYENGMYDHEKTIEYRNNNLINSRNNFNTYDNNYSREYDSKINMNKCVEEKEDLYYKKKINCSSNNDEEAKYYTNANNHKQNNLIKLNRSEELLNERYSSIDNNSREVLFSSLNSDDAMKKIKSGNLDNFHEIKGKLNDNEIIEKKNDKILKENTLSRNNRKCSPYQNNAVIKMNDGILMPINKLSQYSSKWIIKARVQSKDNIRKFFSSNKEGKVFNIELCDEDGEIKANFFGKAVDKWYDFLEVGKIYKISKGNIKPANKKFNTLKHDCEITLDENSIIELLEENDNIPKFIYNFSSIDNIKNMNTGSLVDVIGVVFSFQDIIQVLIKKTGQYKEKRDLIIIDDSNETINVTLWGEHALKIEENDLKDNCIICFKYLKIGEWQGKKLESHPKTKIEINPEIEKAYFLKGWWIDNKKSVYNSINVNTNTFNFENQKTIEEIKKDVNLANENTLSGKGIVFTTFGFIDHIYNSIPVYSACPDCNKKMTTNVVEDDIDSSPPSVESMYCSKCNKNNIPIYNYSLNLKITDDTDSLRASAFANCAKTIMHGLSADEFMKLRQEYILQENIENFDLVEKVKLNEFFFRVKAYMTSHMDELKKNYTILEIIPLSKVLVDNCKYLIKSIKNFTSKKESENE